MPVVYQKMIYPEDLESNPDVRYLFGDNELRQGTGGQARYGRGKENAIGIRTKAAPDNREESFWTDDNLEANRSMLRQDFQPARGHVMAGGVLVIPFDGLGTGLSQLPARAPKTYAFLGELVRELLRVDGAID